MRTRWGWLAAAPLALATCVPVAAVIPAREPVALPQSVLHDSTFCLGCHGGDHPRPEAAKVDPALLGVSVHQGLACVDCHLDVRALPHAQAARVDCARCHDQDASGVTGRHPSLRSAHQARHIPATGKRPDCVDCHGTHDIAPSPARHALAGRQQMPARCGACHREVAAGYAESVHGRALAAGNADVPTCATCHPEHPGSRPAGRQGVAVSGVVATCVSCHDDPGLQRRYAIPAQRLVSFLGSYHGAASELGDSRSANCASCHGTHRILPSRDPRSTVNKANLAHTCGRCHPGAGVHFTQGSVHLRPSPRQDRAVFWVRTAYQVFIACLMSVFLGYITLDLWARRRERRGGPPPHARRDEPQFQRLTLNQRVQHWVLITSFVTLMVTGLPLTAPHSPLSQGVVTFLGGMGARAILHRLAAVLLMLLVGYHGLYVLFSKRGYWEFRQLIPVPRDGLDLLHMLGYYLGLVPTRPEFGRYNYIEKFEYLAVGWGSVVMICTGLLLWAPHLSLLVLPKWLMDVALVAHGWEAILAFLAIIVWHMYNVHWNPSVFPMSKVWLTGKIGLTEFRENHPLEYKRLQENPDWDRE